MKAAHIFRMPGDTRRLPSIASLRAASCVRRAQILGIAQKPPPRQKRCNVNSSRPRCGANSLSIRRSDENNGAATVGESGFHARRRKSAARTPQIKSRGGRSRIPKVLRKSARKPDKPFAGKIRARKIRQSAKSGIDGEENFGATAETKSRPIDKSPHAKNETPRIANEWKAHTLHQIL